MRRRTLLVALAVLAVVVAAGAVVLWPRGKPDRITQANFGLAYKYNCSRDIRTAQQSPVANLLWRAKRLWHRWFP